MQRPAHSRGSIDELIEGMGLIEWLLPSKDYIRQWATSALSLHTSLRPLQLNQALEQRPASTFRKGLVSVLGLAGHAGSIAVIELYCSGVKVATDNI